MTDLEKIKVRDDRIAELEKTIKSIIEWCDLQIAHPECMPGPLQLKKYLLKVLK